MLKFIDYIFSYPHDPDPNHYFTFHDHSYEIDYIQSILNKYNITFDDNSNKITSIENENNIVSKCNLFIKMIVGNTYLNGNIDKFDKNTNCYNFIRYTKYTKL